MMEKYCPYVLDFILVSGPIDKVLWKMANKNIMI
jgi:hypothetical protein